MPPTQLQTPILDGGLKSIHFFNGRLLSAEDLGQEQTANREAHAALGQAAGTGVAYGLEVTETQGVSTRLAPVVTIQPGLAVNRLGQTLRPGPNPAEVALVRVPAASGGVVSALFTDCGVTTGGTYVVGVGVYLLTIRPASGTDGRAPVSGLGNLDAACNARYRVDGVQFRLLQVPVTMSELADGNRLRNQLAYRCFGTVGEAVAAALANPFGPSLGGYGLLDELRSGCLTDEEVPLALLYWTIADGLRFVDMWAVRRRLTAPTAERRWHYHASDRRLSEGEAMFLQFQAQLEALRLEAGASLGSMVAANRFRYLPPAGLLPVAGTSLAGGFNVGTFFGALAPDGSDLIDAAAVSAVIRESFSQQPFDPGQASVGHLTVYRIRENEDAVAAGTAAQPAVLYARSSLAHRGVARLEYSHFDTTRFA